MRNYLMVLLRTLQREKLYAAISIAGLSLGIACCLILALFLRSELTYDRYHEHASQIYRVVNEFNINGKADKFAVTSRMLGPMIKADNPAQILSFVRFQSNGGDSGIVVHHGADTYLWNRSFWVSPNVFEVFTHRLIYGDPKTALAQENTVAVSETFARKYFGNDNPIGQIITNDANIPTKITAVFADQPPNTHLKYDILWSENIPALRDSDNPTARRQSLFGVGIYTYVLMAPGFDAATWPRMSDEFFSRYMTDIAKSINATWHSWLQPIASIHLESNLPYDEPNGNKLYLYGCAAVAIFILVVACINYMNLATARAMRRARSVGIRKILGATRLSLGLQFLAEAVLFSLIALLLALVLIEVLLRFTPLNSLMGDEVLLNLQQPALIAWLLALGLGMGLLSGLYPAIYLSSWAPLSALTGNPMGRKGHLRLREVLVLTQFTISAAVIACTLLMTAQMQYIANKSLGFKKENQLVVTLRGTTTIDKLPSIRTELMKDAHILGVAQSVVTPGQNNALNVAQVENEQGALDQTSIINQAIGDDFVKVMGLKILQGRDFSAKLLTDVGTNWLVNEAMVRKMGWTNPIGKRIQLGAQSGRVIGVVEDFNFRSLHYAIEPLAMLPLINDFSNTPDLARPFQRRLMIVSISGDDVGGTLEHIEKVMTRMDPKHAFEYAFLDDSLDNLYKAEQRLTRLIGIFAAVCIFIACLGLFGLAAFTTEQRTREIGTRKVLGASTWQIITLLSRPILVLVLIASVLASILAYFAMDEWLSGFAYRAGINPLIFLLAGAAAAFIAFATVALQSFKTASADPVHALRHVS